MNAVTLKGIIPPSSVLMRFNCFEVGIGLTSTLIDSIMDTVNGYKNPEDIKPDPKGTTFRDIYFTHINKMIEEVIEAKKIADICGKGNDFKHTSETMTEGLFDMLCDIIDQAVPGTTDIEVLRKIWAYHLVLMSVTRMGSKYMAHRLIEHGLGDARNPISPMDMLAGLLLSPHFKKKKTGKKYDPHPNIDSLLSNLFSNHSGLDDEDAPGSGDDEKDSDAGL